MKKSADEIKKILIELGEEEDIEITPEFVEYANRVISGELTYKQAYEMYIKSNQ